MSIRIWVFPLSTLVLDSEFVLYFLGFASFESLLCFKVRSRVPICLKFRSRVPICLSIGSEYLFVSRVRFKSTYCSNLRSKEAYMCCIRSPMLVVSYA